MNARALFPMMFSMLLSLTAGAFAETREAESESAESQTPRIDVQAFPFSIESPDFRRPILANGSIDQPSTAMFNAFGVGMFATAGADLATTEMGLGRPGVYESNPLQGNRNVRILTHVAAPAFMYWVTDKLHDRGKTKEALLARIGFNVAYSYIVMHNLRTASSMPQ
jgi:hypothetical protein